MLKIIFGTQNLASRRKEVIVSPSSEGIERQTRYLGLLAQRDLSRELVFGRIREVKNFISRGAKKTLKPENIVTNSLDGL